MADDMQWCTEFRLINKPTKPGREGAKGAGAKQVVTVGESGVGDAGDPGETGLDKFIGIAQKMEGDAARTTGGHAVAAEGGRGGDAMRDLRQAMGTTPLKKTPICYHLEQVKRGRRGAGAWEREREIAGRDEWMELMYL